MKIDYASVRNPAERVPFAVHGEGTLRWPVRTALIALERDALRLCTCKEQVGQHFRVGNRAKYERIRDAQAATGDHAPELDAVLAACGGLS